jgi:hypothetical protein
MDITTVGLDLAKHVFQVHGVDEAGHGARRDRVLVVVEPDEAGLGDRGRHRVEAVERSGIRHQARPLGLGHLPDRAIAYLGVRLRLGPSDAAVEQPGVELVVAREAQTRREQPPRATPTWFSTCPFSQPAPGVQATGSTR